MTGSATGLFGGALERAGFAPEEVERRLAVFGPVAAAAGPMRRVEDLAWWHVPGRIEILGKHTDYAGGRSLVCATEQGMAVAAHPRDDGILRVVDAGSGQDAEIVIVQTRDRRGDWTNYPATVAHRLAADFGPLAGLDLTFASDIPIAAGASSSSALVVAVALALIERNRLAERPEYQRNLASTERLAGYLGAVENGRPFGEFGATGGVGTMGGSQDHTAILCGRADAVVQCRWDPLGIERVVPWPDHLLFVVAASGVTAEKAGGALEHYNGLARMTARLSELVAGTGGLVGRRIVDAPAGDTFAAERARIEAAGGADAARLLARFDQLVRECRDYIPGMAAALEADDATALGTIAAASQRGAETALENQIPETVGLVAMARAAGAIGASAFGAGFGGSVWAIIDRSIRDEFIGAWERGYRAAFPARTGVRFFATRPSPGAFRLSFRPAPA
ncbi:MAG: galactokinase family protein [Gemmatimonadales bacterium]